VSEAVPAQPVADLTARRLNALVATEQVRARLPSLVAGVVRDGALVWTGGHGDHSGVGLPGPDTQYRIGSLTKTVTAVLLLQLREEGLLSLGDRLDRHLPGVGYADRTLRTLLSHASGMHSEPVGPWWERSPGVEFEQLAAGVDDGLAVFEPGVTHHYTNLAFGLLGEVAARAGGASWWELVQRRVLRPLGMQRTTYLPAAPAATGYSVHHFAGTLSEEPSQDTGAMAAAGQLWSTVEDLARFSRVLLGQAEEVLPAAAVEEMGTPQSGTAASGTTDTYGLGLRLVAGGAGTLMGHTGSMPGFLAGLLVDPVRRTGAICLANGTTGLRCEGLPRDLLTELERCEPSIPEPWRPTTAVDDRVAEVLGLWHWGNSALAFGLDGGEVVVRSLATGVVTSRFRLESDGGLVGTAGYHHGERLRVVRRADGQVNHLECATFVYTRRPYDPGAPIPGGPPAGG
jgi:CubicO group peptidase (beta-lactamase class C family)